MDASSGSKWDQVELKEVIQRLLMSGWAYPWDRDGRPHHLLGESRGTAQTEANCLATNWGLLDQAHSLWHHRKSFLMNRKPGQDVGTHVKNPSLSFGPKTIKGIKTLHLGVWETSEVQRCNRAIFLSCPDERLMFSRDWFRKGKWLTNRIKKIILRKVFFFIYIYK